MTEDGDSPVPISPIPREARPYQGHRAGLVTRMAASAIDALVVGLILLAEYAVLAGLLFLVNPRDFTLPKTSLLLSMTAAFVVLVLYLTCAWSITGRTYGCHVMGLRVVGARGRRLRPLGALVRALLCALFPIGLLWCAGSRANRSLQDTMLRTSVIYDWRPRSLSGTSLGAPISPREPRGRVSRRRESAAAFTTT
jgi:uncharacterized RDD family membrane protein YckC